MAAVVFQRFVYLDKASQSRSPHGCVGPELGRAVLSVIRRPFGPNVTDACVFLGLGSDVNRQIVYQAHLALSVGRVSSKVYEIVGRIKRMSRTSGSFPSGYEATYLWLLENVKELM